jgi:hypothetical protein
MSTAAFMETATSECPVSDITVKGTTTDEFEALDAVVSDYSDGYFATVTMTNDGEFFTNAGTIVVAEVVAVAAVADDSSTADVDETAAAVDAVAAVNANLVFTFGAGTLSAAGGDMGAYTAVVNIDSDYALTAAGDLMFFGGDVAIDTTTGSTANFVGMYAGSKYDATVPAISAAWAEAGVATVSFYMPAEPETATDAESVANVGDRLDTGDVVALWTGFTATGTVPLAVCGSGATIIMGAATLAAGSAAFAAALAF